MIFFGFVQQRSFGLFWVCIQSVFFGFAFNRSFLGLRSIGLFSAGAVGIIMITLIHIVLSLSFKLFITDSACVIMLVDVHSFGQSDQSGQSINPRLVIDQRSIT